MPSLLVCLMNVLVEDGWKLRKTVFLGPKIPPNRGRLVREQSQRQGATAAFLPLQAAAKQSPKAASARHIS